MNHFQTILSDIFDRGAESRLSLDEERETIHAAKAGDEAALTRLLYAYAASLRNVVRRHTELLGAEDARAAAIAGFCEALYSFDPEQGQRLAGTLPAYLADELANEHATRHGISVPSRTLKRFFGILRRAGGDVDLAAALAPKFKMSRETFYAIAEAVQVQSPAENCGAELSVSEFPEGARPIWGDEEQYADAEDRILVEMAFGAVDDLETDICRASYGFTSYNPIPDGQIAADLSMTRPTVQRRRAGALSKMRDALGA